MFLYSVGWESITISLLTCQNQPIDSSCGLGVPVVILRNSQGRSGAGVWRREACRGWPESQTVWLPLAGRYSIDESFREKPVLTPCTNWLIPAPELQEFWELVTKHGHY